MNIKRRGKKGLHRLKLFVELIKLNLDYSFVSDWLEIVSTVNIQ